MKMGCIDRLYHILAIFDHPELFTLHNCFQPFIQTYWSNDTDQIQIFFFHLPSEDVASGAGLMFSILLKTL